MAKNKVQITLRIPVEDFARLELLAEITDASIQKVGVASLHAGLLLSSGMVEKKMTELLADSLDEVVKKHGK